ncbi:MAG: lysylphosphatidylglycerol synthase domain-containing protein [Gemmatales bacterium]|nr:lysylphosphatidylglycerol synthase domain-containing protein [Gemmatales bacterium]
MRYAKLIIKWLITSLVVGFVAWEFMRQWSRLPEDAWRIEMKWLVVSGLIYIVAFLPSFGYWTWCLRRLGQPTPFGAILRAYFVGHLGKYVPGKALVPVLRAALLQSVRVHPAAAVLAVVCETLTCMAAGSFLVAVLLGVFEDAGTWSRLLFELLGQASYSPRWPFWATVGSFALLGLFMLVPLVPAGFNRLAHWLVRQTTRDDLVSMQGLSLHMLILGLLVGIATWMLLGLSHLAVIEAVAPVAWTGNQFWLVTLSGTAAVVLGFVSLLPGGFGVREGVLALLLARTVILGAPQAALVAVLIRVVWLVSEVVVAAGLVAPHVLQWLSSSRERREAS